MPKDKREASLEKIRNSKTTRCILISFKAGSTGEFCGRLRLALSFHTFSLFSVTCYILSQLEPPVAWKVFFFLL